MPAESATPPAEQRVLAALYTASGTALMLLFVWHQFDPDGPAEAYGRLRERVSAWRRARRELAQTLEQIHKLPEISEELELEEERRCEER